MAVIERSLPELQEQHGGLNVMPPGKVRVYAIAFDLDVETLKNTYGSSSYGNAYGDIKRRFLEEGFTWMQGSLYYGDKKTTPVDCVLVVQRLARELPWFGDSVRDIRMLRIEENNDLRPAIPQPALSLRP